MRIRIGEDVTRGTVIDEFEAYAQQFGDTPVILEEKDRYLGALSIGAPGRGKSTFLLTSAYQDIINRIPLILIEPSSQLAIEIYTLAKRNRRSVTYVSKENPMAGINILCAPYSPHQRAELTIEFLNHITLTTSSDLSATTRMRNVVYEHIIWCIENGRPRLDALLERLQRKPDGKNQYAIDGVVARLESILSDQAVCDILCSENAINPLEIASNKDVLIIDTFGFGYLPGIAVGSALTFLLRDSFLAVRREQFDLLSVYIDEAHLYMNESFLALTKMARKFKLMMTLATQDLISVPSTLRQVLLANIGTLLALNPGMQDARLLSAEFKNLSDMEVKFNDQYHAAVRTPRFEGIVRMQRPPYVRPLPLPRLTLSEVPIWFVST